MECESKSGTSNNVRDWNHLKITQQHTGKARNQASTKNSHTGHFALNSESTAVKVQNMLHVGSKFTCSTNCKYRTAATLYTLDTWYVSGM